jgi:hypothetical protein
MELDELKKELKQKLEQDSATPTIKPIESCIQQRSSSVIAKIRRNIVTEILLSLLFLPAFIWVFIQYSSIYTRFFMGFGVLFCIAFMVYLWKLYKKIILVETVSLSVRENLVQVVSIVSHFTRIYFQITMMMLPIAFMAGIATGYLDIAGSGELVARFKWTDSIVYYICFFVAWSVFVYFFTKWYIKKLYGDFLRQLRAQLKELDNT